MNNFITAMLDASFTRFLRSALAWGALLCILILFGLWLAGMLQGWVLIVQVIVFSMLIGGAISGIREVHRIITIELEKKNAVTSNFSIPAKQ